MAAGTPSLPILRPRAPRLRAQRALQGTWRLLLGAAVALIMVLPLIWVLLSSFKDASEVIAVPTTLWPQSWSWDNYDTIFTALPFGRYLLNSLVVTLSITALTLLTSSLAGYVFAKFQFPAKELLFTLVLATLMVPFAVTVLPLYLLISQLGMLNTYQGLIVPFACSAFGIFLMRQFMEDTPTELIEAARIDGTSEFGIWARIMLPLSSSALVGVGIFAFLAAWNQLWWPVMVVSTAEDMRTLTLGIFSLQSQITVRYDMLITGAAIGVLPVMLVFALTQRRIVDGISLTGLK